MKYIKYKRLISFFAKLMAFIKRNRIVILSALLGVTAVTSALLVSNGSIVSDSGLPLEIVYGQEISFEANAFMSDVHYQYFDYKLNCWVEGFPKDPGQYTIRAYSKTMFNKTRYGKEHSVTILPKQIIFIVEEDQIRYGDMPTAILKEGSVLAYSDSFTCDGFEFFDLDKEQVQVSPTVEGVKITRTILDTTTDVTAYYDIAVEKTDIDVTARELEITVDDADRDYDGTP